MSLSNLFTQKQIGVLKQAKMNLKWRLMINYGAKSAGKTFVDNFLFMNEVKHAAKLAKKRHDTHPKYILAGASSKTIYNNVISELETTFGIQMKADNHKSYHIKFKGLPDVTIVQAYTATIAGLAGIRGMTSYGAYINEASLAVEIVFDEIRDRCRVPGARVICDTNPDIPTHYLKNDYIDKKSDKIICNHFTIFDNTKLPKDYVDNIIETTPKGMFYDRNILGKWVSGEGLVYSDFNKEKMAVNHDTIPTNLKLFCGVDFGWNHFGSIVVIGKSDDSKYYLLEERTRRHMSDDWWIATAHDLDRKYHRNLTYYCDYASPDYIDKMQRSGLDARYANKQVFEGISMLASLIKGGQFFYADNEAEQSLKESEMDEEQETFITEIFQYVWQKGTDKPEKKFDHVLDAIRYAIFTEHLENENKVKLYKL